MAYAVSFPSRASSEHRDLAHWMERSLEELAQLRSDLNDDTVHDLRVALRRCRSIAAAIEEIDPHPDWREMRSCARKLFRALGDLRDAQVMTDWLQKLHPEEDALKRRIQDSLAAAEVLAQEKALRRAQRFDEKRWKKLAHSLRARIRRVPEDGDAAHCQALERLERAKELHRRSMRTERPGPWHALRIGVKQFRYTLEPLLPTLHRQWSDTVKRVQDVLGNIHDLDMLGDRLAQMTPDAELSEEVLKDWRSRIENERQRNILTYRQLALGTPSIWTEWQSGFPREQWDRYAKARIRATRSAMDPKLRRTALITRIGMRLWSQLRLCHAGEIFSDKKERRVLEAAARLSGVRRGKVKKAREKSAKSFLLNSSVPPGWSYAEWERAAWAIRFQRGAEPGPGNKRFRRLSADQQTRIVLLAGILRLAMAAARSGVIRSSSLHVERLPQGLLLRMVGVEDSPKNAARFIEAKRQLERSLGTTILVQPQPAITVDLASQAAEPASGAGISIVR